ncbi:hypothetical protein LINPERHAP1_LOCUS22829, partial [Linum perenne]
MNFISRALIPFPLTTCAQPLGLTLWLADPQGYLVDNSILREVVLWYFVYDNMSRLPPSNV